jgi:hypothetical protein
MTSCGRDGRIYRWFRCADATAREGRRNTHFLSLSTSLSFRGRGPPALLLLLLGFTGGMYRYAPVASETGRGGSRRWLPFGWTRSFPPLRPALLWPHALGKRPRLGRAAGEPTGRTDGKALQPRPSASKLIFLCPNDRPQASSFLWCQSRTSSTRKHEPSTPSQKRGISQTARVARKGDSDRCHPATAPPSRLPPPRRRWSGSPEARASIRTTAAGSSCYKMPKLNISGTLPRNLT